MSRKEVDIGVRLSASEDVSTVTKGAVDKASAELDRLGRKSGSTLSTGQAAMIGAASYGAFRALNAASEKFEEQQYAGANLRIAAMDRYGQVNERVYAQETEFIKKLSSTYSKSVADYTKLGVVLQANRVSAEDFMNGVGESAAKLSLAFDDMDPAAGGEFFAHLKNDLHVANSDMGRLADMAYRLHKIGVGKTGEEAVSELNQAFSKASLGATNLGMSGVKDAEELGVLMGTFIAKGLSGQTVGNNFRRIFDGMRSPEKMAKVMGNAQMVGVDLSFFDKSGNFKGIENFEQQLKKLSKLNPQLISAVLEPFSGKQGLSTDFLEYLGKYGEDVDLVREHYEGMGSLNDAVRELTATLKVQKSITRTNFENMEAAFGKSMQGDIGKVNSLLNKSILHMTDFIENHPHLSNLAGDMVALGAAYGTALTSLKALAYFSPTAKLALEALAGSSIFTAFAGLASSMLIAKEWAEWASAKSNEQVKNNPTGNRERMMAGMNKVIEDPHTGFFKRNWARALKFGMASNIALFGDDEANPNVDLANDSRDKVLADIKASRTKSRPLDPSRLDPDAQARYAADRQRGRDLEAQRMKELPWLASIRGVQPAPQQTLTIAPVYHIAGVTTEAEIMKILKKNNSDIGQMVMDMMSRSRALSYTE